MGKRTETVFFIFGTGTGSKCLNPWFMAQGETCDPLRSRCMTCRLFCLVCCVTRCICLPATGLTVEHRAQKGAALAEVSGSTYLRGSGALRGCRVSRM